MPANDLHRRALPYFSGEKEAFATTLVSALIMMYGIEVLEWDPLTIQLEVKDDLGIEMPRRVYDKMMALIGAITTDRVYTDVEVFDETVNAVTGHSIGVDHDIPTVEEVAWTVNELGLIDPEPVSRPKDRRFSKDIARYVRVVLDDAGMRRAPSILGFASSRTVPKEGHDAPAYYAGAWGSAQAQADEIDNWVTDLSEKLLMQLMDIGVTFNQQPETDTWEEQSEKPVREEKKVAVASWIHDELSNQLTARCAAVRHEQ